MLSVLRNVTKEETVQYVLAMLVQMLAGAAGLAVVEVLAPREWACFAPHPAPTAGLHPPAQRTPPHQPLLLLPPPPLPRTRRPAVNPARARLFHQQEPDAQGHAADPYTVFLRWAARGGG